MKSKMKEDEFLGDTKALLRPEIHYSPELAWRVVKEKIIENI